MSPVPRWEDVDGDPTPGTEQLALPLGAAPSAPSRDMALFYGARRAGWEPPTVATDLRTDALAPGWQASAENHLLDAFAELPPDDIPWYLQ